MLPYQMVISTYICLMAALLKNHLYTSESDDAFFRTIFGTYEVIITAIAYPIIMLPACRFFILRKARGLTN